jgi:hypothetical protein
MAKVKITGHASGSGVITVTAPNTSTDRTITLPDATATIATTTDVAARLPSITDGGNATAMTINSSEQVGVGLAAPSETLHVYKTSSADAGLVNVIKVQTDTNNSIGDGSAIAFHGKYNSTEWGFGKIGGANSGSNWGGALEFHTNAGNNSSPSIAYTKQLTITQDGRGLSQFTAKGWINFNGTGTIAIRDSHNVSSIQDAGTGNYDVFWNVDLANANYSPVGSSGSPSSESYRSRQLTITGIAAGSTSVNTIFDEDTRLDAELVSLQVFGD